MGSLFNLPQYGKGRKRVLLRKRRKSISGKKKKKGGEEKRDISIAYQCRRKKGEGRLQFPYFLILPARKRELVRKKKKKEIRERRVCFSPMIEGRGRKHSCFIPSRQSGRPRALEEAGCCLSS